MDKAFSVSYADGQCTTWGENSLSRRVTPMMREKGTPVFLLADDYEDRMKRDDYQRRNAIWRAANMEYMVSDRSDPPPIQLMKSRNRLR